MPDRDRLIGAVPRGTPPASSFEDPSLEDSSFEVFYRAHYPDVARLAGRVLGDHHAGQDVAQDVFLAAHERFRGDVDKAPGWVRLAAVHAALNVLRGDRRRLRRHLLTARPATVAGPEDAVLAREADDEVRRALAKLPTRAATVLILRHGGSSYVEIAEAMNVKVGAVGTMLRRAESAVLKEMRHASRP